MLADEGESAGHVCSLSAAIHQPREWPSSLIKFIAGALPGWRDDPAREAVAGEIKLTLSYARAEQPVASLARLHILQFLRQEPYEADGRRAIDLVASPSGQVILIEGREYNEYQTLCRSSASG